jgi:hypothetical protein
MEKPQILDYFCQGVTAVGDLAIAHTGMNALPCDVALIQGFVHQHGKSAPHLQLRQDAVNLQKNNNKHSLIVDSNLFLYVDKSNPLHYLRYSFDGVFPTTGFYFDKDIDPTRWQQISRDLNIGIKPWRSNGNHILLCLQRNGGWSMDGYDVQNWTIDTIKKLRNYTDRTIIIRGHPGDSNAKKYLDPKNPECKIRGFKNVIFSEFGRSLEQDLKNCWAVINHNSSPVVGAAIEGYPIFVSDPLFVIEN